MFIPTKQPTQPDHHTFRCALLTNSNTLQHNKLLTRTVLADIDWTYRIAAHPLLEDVVDEAEMNERTETEDDGLYTKEVEALDRLIAEQLCGWGPDCTTSGAG
jgi:hypothetical protein